MRSWLNQLRAVAEDREAVENETRETLARVRELVSRRGFEVDICEWLAKTIAANRVKVGSEQDMLYKIGFRDGLEAVAAHCEVLKTAAKE